MTQPLSYTPHALIPSPEELATQWGSELAVAAPGDLVSFALPAPERSLCSVLGVLGEEEDRFVWAPSEGPSWIGAGSAFALEPAAGGTIGSLRSAAQSGLERTRLVSHDLPDREMTDVLRPRLFGGFAFSAGSTGEEWSALGEGRFVLPRWLYARREEAAGNQGAALVLTLGPEHRGEVQHWARRAVERLGALLADRSTVSATRDLERVHATEPVLWRELRDEAESFKENVEQILSEIHAAAFDKIVAARCRVLELNGELDLGRAIERLAQSAHESTRFAFARQGSLFFGATPERLVRTSGRLVESEALAGTIALESSDEAADRLRESRKDLHEHSSVVRHVVERLRPICSELSWPEEPRVRELRNLIHLETPIRGRLDRRRHVLDLVELLHPTPAVGGVPVDEAIEWIERHETTPRGWYSGPIGWFDTEGNGDFAVALRSCLVHAGRAHLFAGSGIVADSVPEAELEETRVKQRSMQEALSGAVVRRAGRVV